MCQFYIILIREIGGRRLYKFSKVGIENLNIDCYQGSLENKQKVL